MTLETLAETLRAGDGYLIITHAKPDGDAIGSGAALCLILRRLGKTAFVAPNEDMTPRYAPFVEGLLPHDGFEPRTVVAVDIADKALFPAGMKKDSNRVDICIDHHPSNKMFAGKNYVRAGASATGEIVYELARELKVELTERELSAIYLAVSTDTGCFRYSNTTALAHEIAARAIEAGVDFYGINYEFFSKKTRARFNVEKALLGGLRLEGGGKIAGASLTREYLGSVGASEDDLDNLSSIVISLEGLCCAVLAVEQKSGGTKISVRTRAPLDASRICAQFGGGGHARAAGCMLACGVDDALDMLLLAAQRASAEHTGGPAAENAHV